MNQPDLTALQSALKRQRDIGKMAKTELKTKPMDVDPGDFVEALEHDSRRTDARALLALFGRVTSMQPKMWGASIIGYGRYDYKYESGREGTFMITGFSPRKANLVIYIMPGYRDMSAKLKRLGKHKLGKSCLYINKLDDIELDVLEEIVVDGLTYMRANYRTFER